jgi:hypothetical protein
VCLQPAHTNADTGDHPYGERILVRAPVTILLSSVALAAALTACGGGGPSKATFVTKADGSCAAGNAAIAGVTKPTNPTQIGAGAATAASTIDGQVSALRALKPRGSDTQQFAGVVSAIADVSGPAKALQDAAGKNDDAAIGKAAVDLQSKVDTAATQGQAFGLTQCGVGLKPAVGNLFDGTKSVVKAGFVTKAEALCRAANTKINAIATPGSTLASVSKYFDAVMVISNKLAADLKALPTPPGDEGAVNEFNAAFDALNAKGKDTAAAAKANNAKLVVALSDELDVAGTALNAKLDAYGLKVCGTTGS